MVIGPDAEVRDSIIMNDTVIGAGATVHKAIIDKRVDIGENARVGFRDDNTPNAPLPEVLNTGITLVGKGARVPAGLTLGRNVVVHPGAREEDFGGDVESGGSVG